MSDAIEIKLVKTKEEVNIFREMISYAFGATPKKSAKEKREQEESKPDYFEKSNRYILYDKGIPMSSLHSIPMTQNVRGKLYPMQGIAGVSTYPEYRRQGHVRLLMQHAFKEGKEHGEILSSLYPFRESFYYHFGYFTFPHARTLKVNPSNLRDTQHYTVGGMVERQLLGEVIDRYYQLTEHLQEKLHGMSLFSREIQERLETNKSWVVFAVINGEDRGALVFSTKGFEKELKVSEFLYLDSNAKYLLLDHLARHSDQFSEIHMRLFSQDQPETWLLDTKMTFESRDWVPSGMGRVLDVANLGGMNVGTGSISITIEDEYCSWNQGTWQLSSERGKLKVEKVEQEADVSMSIQAFSALIYGYYHLDDLYLRGSISNYNHNELLEQLFPKLLPELFAIF